eukprot:963892-Prorocentrum_minimum.AAC.1
MAMKPKSAIPPPDNSTISGCIFEISESRVRARVSHGMFRHTPFFSIFNAKSARLPYPAHRPRRSRWSGKSESGNREF